MNILLPSSKTLFFATERYYDRKSQPRAVQSSYTWYIYHITPAPQVQGSLPQKTDKLYDAERQGVHGEIVSPMNTKSYIHKVWTTLTAQSNS